MLIYTTALGFETATIPYGKRIIILTSRIVLIITLSVVFVFVDCVLLVNALLFGPQTLLADYRYAGYEHHLLSGALSRPSGGHNRRRVWLTWN